jgi:hypothetical protein
MYCVSPHSADNTDGKLHTLKTFQVPSLFSKYVNMVTFLDQARRLIRQTNIKIKKKSN